MKHKSRSRTHIKQPSRSQTLLKYYSIALCISLVMLAFFHQTAVQAYNAQQPLQEPNWLPFMGRADVGCTTGNAKAPKCTNGGLPYHPWPAIDLHMPASYPIRATADGKVVRVRHNTAVPEDDPNNQDPTDDGVEARAGFYIAIEHNSPTSKLSVYKHIAESLVSEGQLVKRGQVIALEGKTASPTYHLHYDEQKGEEDFNSPVNRVPLGVMRARTGDGNLVYYPNTLGTTNWSNVTFGTSLYNYGYVRSKIFVANEREYRNALTELSRYNGAGPAIIKVNGAFNLSATGTYQYSGKRPLIIEGKNQSTIVSAQDRQFLYSSSDQPIELINMKVRFGRSQGGNGGAIFAVGPVTVIDSDISSSKALQGKGGGVFSQNDVNIVRSNIFNNRALDGGGVYGRKVRIIESAFTNNEALNSAGASYSTQTTALSNTTISGNFAKSVGGVYSTTNVVARHVTFYNNKSNSGGANIATPAQLTSLASVYTLPQTKTGQTTTDCQVGSVLSWGYNVEAGSSCGLTGLGDRQNRFNAGLTPLSYNGGRTLNHRPLLSSILVNAYEKLPEVLTGYKSPTVCDTSSAIDQRGGWYQGLPWSDDPPLYSRPKNGSCDIGAIEL